MSTSITDGMQPQPSNSSIITGGSNATVSVSVGTETNDAAGATTTATSSFDVVSSTANSSTGTTPTSTDQSSFDQKVIHFDQTVQEEINHPLGDRYVRLEQQMSNVIAGDEEDEYDEDGADNAYTPQIDKPTIDNESSSSSSSLATGNNLVLIYVVVMIVTILVLHVLDYFRMADNNNIFGSGAVILSSTATASTKKKKSSIEQQQTRGGEDDNKHMDDTVNQQIAIQQKKDSYQEDVQNNKKESITRTRSNGQCQTYCNLRRKLEVLQEGCMNHLQQLQNDEEESIPAIPVQMIYTQRSNTTIVSQITDSNHKDPKYSGVIATTSRTLEAQLVAGHGHPSLPVQMIHTQRSNTTISQVTDSHHKVPNYPGFITTPSSQALDEELEKQESLIGKEEKVHKQFLNGLQQKEERQPVPVDTIHTQRSTSTVSQISDSHHLHCKSDDSTSNIPRQIVSEQFLACILDEANEGKEEKDSTIEEEALKDKVSQQALFNPLQSQQEEKVQQAAPLEIIDTQRSSRSVSQISDSHHMDHRRNPDPLYYHPYPNPVHIDTPDKYQPVMNMLGIWELGSYDSFNKEGEIDPSEQSNLRVGVKSSRDNDNAYVSEATPTSAESLENRQVSNDTCDVKMAQSYDESDNSERMEDKLVSNIDALSLPYADIKNQEHVDGRDAENNKDVDGCCPRRQQANCKKEEPAVPTEFAIRTTTDAHTMSQGDDDDDTLEATNPTANGISTQPMDEGIQKPNGTLATIDEEAVDNDPHQEEASGNLGLLEAQYDAGHMYHVSKNYTMAVKYYQMSAQQGCAKSQYCLGNICRLGTGVSKDLRRAIKWYTLAAEQGHADAQASLGTMYRLGQGVRQDPVEAREWYLLAAIQGHVAAQSNLGFMYSNEDHCRALQWYRLAGNQGNVHAQYNLGVFYENGKSVPQDCTRAAEWFRLAATNGLARAQHRMGCLYEMGQGVPQDFTKAAEWHQQSAEQGNAKSQVNLGVLHELGKGVPKDYAKANELFKRAANQGDPHAHRNLGALYERGRGVAQSYAEAVTHYQSAANQGDPKAQFDLGYLHYHGKGVPQDFTKAVEWCQLAAKQGHADAQYTMGIFYEIGKGLSQDYAEAGRWYQLAAQQGHPQAQCIIGNMFASGHGASKDAAKAVEWWQSAANMGNAEAQYRLGTAYNIGYGVFQDYTKAFKWYQLAVKQGHIKSKMHLGTLYELGFGVPQDHAKAMEWYQSAANEGYTDADVKVANRDKGTFPESNNKEHVVSSDDRLGSFVYASSSDATAKPFAARPLTPVHHGSKQSFEHRQHETSKKYGNQMPPWTTSPPTKLCRPPSGGHKHGDDVSLNPGVRFHSRRSLEQLSCPKSKGPSRRVSLGDTAPKVNVKFTSRYDLARPVMDVSINASNVSLGPSIETSLNYTASTLPMSQDESDVTEQQVQEHDPLYKNSSESEEESRPRRNGNDNDRVKLWLERVGLFGKLFSKKRRQG